MKKNGYYKKCDRKGCIQYRYSIPSKVLRGGEKYCSTYCADMIKRGKKHSLEIRKKMSLSQKKTDNKGRFIKGQRPSLITEFKKGENSNEKNPTWKGDAVGYGALHQWVRKNLLQPEGCERCRKRNVSLELSNTSLLYKRDLSDWEYLCKSCHAKKDRGNGHAPAVIFETIYTNTGKIQFGKRKEVSA